MVITLEIILLLRIVCNYPRFFIYSYEIENCSFKVNNYVGVFGGNFIASIDETNRENNPLIYVSSGG